MVVPVDEQNCSEALFLQLRNKFLENLNVNGNYDDYEDVDIERIRNDDAYCNRFILHKHGKFEEALKMVDEALKWRKSFGVKGVTQASIPLEFFQAKAVFPFNSDKEGNPIILILVRFHKKAPEFIQELRRFVIYWVELMEEQTNGGHMTVIMSCSGAGLSNLDLDLIKFLITLFRSYYPDSLAHILIYELPWILNPAWKIIKAWLPEDFVDKIKFVNKTTIQDYVSEDNLPLEMGGTDATEYEPPSAVSDINSNSVGVETKRVSNGYGIHRSSSKDASSHVLITDDYTVIGGILKIWPATELEFQNPPITPNDAVIKLSNISEKSVSYKVKTNNIESYRVKPSIGIIESGKSIDISVMCISGFHPQQTDKFLIMAMEVSDANLSATNLNSLWKSTSSDVIADHKLKCVLKKDDESIINEESEMEKSLKSINHLLSKLENKMQSIDAKQSSLHFQQTITLCLTLFLSLLFFCHILMAEDSPLLSAVHRYF